MNYSVFDTCDVIFTLAAINISIKLKFCNFLLLNEEKKKMHHRNGGKFFFFGFTVMPFSFYRWGITWASKGQRYDFLYENYAR